MYNFKEYCEAAEVVDKLGDIVLEMDINGFVGDRVLGGAAEIGKGVLGGLGSLAKSSLGGVGQGLRRLFWGSKSVDKADAQNEFKKAKVDLMKALMNMEVDERRSEIERFKSAIDSLKNIDSTDPHARMNWLQKMTVGSGLRGAKPDYNKLAR